MSTVPDQISRQELFKIWFSKLTPEQKAIAIDVLKEMAQRKLPNQESDDNPSALG